MYVIILVTNKKGCDVMSEIMTPTQFRKDLFLAIKKVNHDSEPIVISGRSEQDSAVLVSKEDWDAITETLLLEQVGVMDKVRKREKDDSGFTNVDDIDWDNI